MADQAKSIFKDSIPISWRNADWESLEKSIVEVDKILDEMKNLSRDLEYWAREIANLETRMQDVLFVEKQLKDKSDGETIKPSKEWSNALAFWENGDLSVLWAKGLFDELEKALRDLEIFLLEYDERLKNVLYRTEGPSEITTPTQPVVEKQGGRYTIKHSSAKKTENIRRTGELSVEQFQHSRISPSFEPEKKPSGMKVKAKTPYSDEVLEVDISHIGEGFELVDESTVPKKKEK
jgi:hypothetical protein